MKKTILFIFCLIGIQTVGFSQGFSNFVVNGSLERPVIKNVSNGPSMIECIVGDDVDIKNVDFKFRLLSGCSLETDLHNDFTEPQKVVVLKNDGSAKLWVVAIKRLTPAQLPLNLSFSKDNTSDWSSDVVGWAGIGVDERKNTVVRFGNKDVSFWTAFSSPAKTVSYELLPVSREKVDFDGYFSVETSKDGKKWKELHGFDSKNGFNESGKYSHDLPKDARFIRWTYVVRNRLNVNLNDISIE